MLNKAEGLTGEIIASPADGALLPETYRYEWGDDRARLIERMAWIRMYGTAGGTTPEAAAESIRNAVADGFNCIKTGVGLRGNGRVIETAEHTDNVVAIFAAMREAVGPKIDIAIDFHGAVAPQTAKRLVKALEPYHPFFIEEPVQCQNVDVLADITHSTSVPIATGERLFTKWGFREVLEKRAASILQPDLSHAGGILETRLIAGMAEAYYAAIAPHCPLGPIALASCIHLDAAIPNFLAQEGGRITGEGYIKTPYKHVDGYLPLPTAPGLGIDAVGYLGFDGDMDVAIAIRTGVIKNKTLYVQAGAGIVADSIPHNEWVETQNKAKAVLRAAEIVQSGK